MTKTERDEMEWLRMIVRSLKLEMRARHHERFCAHAGARCDCEDYLRGLDTSFPVKLTAYRRG